MVRSFTGLLKQRYEDKLDAKADEYIYFAADAAEHMQALIDDMLSCARVGQDRAMEETEVGKGVDLV